MENVKEKLLQILDKNVEQEKLMKDLGVYVMECWSGSKKPDPKDLLKILGDNVNEQQLLKDFGMQVVIPFAKEEAAKTSTPIDDIAISIIEKVLS